jgi:hypothetical protein
MWFAWGVLLNSGIGEGKIHCSTCTGIIMWPSGGEFMLLFQQKGGRQSTTIKFEITINVFTWHKYLPSWTVIVHSGCYDWDYVSLNSRAN